MNIEGLIDSLQAGDNVNATANFNSAIADKLRVAIDTKKIEVASSLGSRISDSLEQE